MDESTHKLIIVNYHSVNGPRVRGTVSDLLPLLWPACQPRHLATSSHMMHIRLNFIST